MDAKIRIRKLKHFRSAVFEKIAVDPRFDNIPLILETPDESLWKQEIAYLISKAN